MRDFAKYMERLQTSEESVGNGRQRQVCPLLHGTRPHMMRPADPTSAPAARGVAAPSGVGAEGAAHLAAHDDDAAQRTSEGFRGPGDLSALYIASAGDLRAPGDLSALPLAAAGDLRAPASSSSALAF